MEDVIFELIVTGLCNPDKIDDIGNTALTYAIINQVEKGSLILAEIKKHGYDKYLSKLSENDKIANIFDI